MSRCDPGAAPSAGELIARYDAHAPRYTSYPTAAQFTPAVGAETWAGWLAAAPDEPASLYVHIPFCKRLCWYCGCNTRAMNRAESISAIAAGFRWVPAPGRQLFFVRYPASG